MIDRNWNELNDLLYENRRAVNRVGGSGFCFLAAVARCLMCDHSYLTTVKSIQEKVLDHLIERGDMYSGFIDGTAANLVMDACNFFEDRDFNRDVVDILVLATADALKLKIKIIRKSPTNKIQFLVIEGNRSEMEIILKYDTHDDPNNLDYVGANHYDAIIKSNVIHEEGTSEYMSPNHTADDTEYALTEDTYDIRQEGESGEQSPELFYISSDDQSEQTAETYNIHGDSHQAQSPGTCGIRPDQPESETSKAYDIRPEHLHFSHSQSPQQIETEHSDAIRPENAQQSHQYHPLHIETEPSRAIRTEPNEFLFPSDTEESLLEMYLRPSTKFPTYLYDNLTPKAVDFCPANIDGNKVYIVKCDDSNFVKNTSDRRWFYMRTSSKTGFRGKVKVGTCQGSWLCINEECSFLKSEHIPNNSHFEYKCGVRVCYSCGRFASQRSCGARKYVLYSHGSEHAYVYHLGYHQCTLRTEVTSDREFTKRCVEKYPGLSFGDLKTTVIQDLMDDGDIEGSQSAAERITYKAYRSVKAQVRADLDFCEVTTQCLEAVVEVKKGSDRIDDLYIYEVNSSRMNNLPDFVVKSSSTILSVAVDMDISGPSNIMQDEECYFDGCHSRCKDFISFGLWVRHTSMRRLIKLSCMETRKEDTQAVAIFFNKLNEMLRKVTKKKDYIFNPKNVMMDEAGQNFNGLLQVFGQAWVDEKCVTCQFHFKNNMQEHKYEIKEEYRDNFLRLADQLCIVKSVTEFELIYAQMQEIVGKSPEAGPFLDWHYVRRVRTFPAFREHLHAGANNAEIGNAQWKPPHKLSLVAAAKDDINKVMQLEADLRRFRRGETFHRGQAPNDVQRATAERRFQMEQGRSFAQVLQNEVARQMDEDAHNDPPHFRPSQSSRHKPKKKAKGVQGVPGNRNQPAPTLTELLTKLNAAKNIETSAGNALFAQEEQDDCVLGRGPEPRKIRSLPNEKPYIVYSQPSVSVCQGCPKVIEYKSMKAPNNLVIRLKAIRPYRDARTKIWIDRVNNIYFHPKMQCLQKFKQHGPEDLHMTQEMFTALSNSHMQLLQKWGYLQHITANLEKEIPVSSINALYNINNCCSG